MEILDYESPHKIFGNRVSERLMPLIPWWEVLAAKIFGKRVTGVDMDVVVTGHRWRGILYIQAVEPRKRLPKMEFSNGNT